MGNKKYKIVLFVLGILLLVVYFYLKENKNNVLKRHDSKTNLDGVYEYKIHNKDTVFHGKFTQYNENGIKKAEGNFVNGHIFGKCIYYFDNANIESVHFRKNSQITIESIWNYPNGKIRKYLKYDDFGMSSFIIYFDEQGNIKDYKGYPIMEIYQYKIANKERFKVNINQYLKVGDILKHKYLIADIPNAKRVFKIENIGIDSTKIKRKFIKKPPVEIDIEEILIKKGVNKIRATVQYQFNDIKKTVINDTIRFEVNVN